MILQLKRALAWSPVVGVPAFVLAALAAPGLGCELLVNVDTMLDGSPDDVVVPQTLDGYDCPICKDVSPDADFDGDDGFPEAEAEDTGTDTSALDASSDSRLIDAEEKDAEAGLPKG